MHVQPAPTDFGGKHAEAPSFQVDGPRRPPASDADTALFSLRVA